MVHGCGYFDKCEPALRDSISSVFIGFLYSLKSFKCISRKLIVDKCFYNNYY